jgi:hypothetical protein
VRVRAEDAVEKDVLAVGSDQQAGLLNWVEKHLVRVRARVRVRVRVARAGVRARVARVRVRPVCSAGSKSNWLGLGLGSLGLGLGLLGLGLGLGLLGLGLGLLGLGLLGLGLGRSVQLGRSAPGRRVRTRG